MDQARISDAAAAWLDLWCHGGAHPGVVLASFRRLEAQARDPRALAAVERARRVAARVPFGSIQDFAE
jgi:glutathione S-transferase